MDTHHPRLDLDPIFPKEREVNLRDHPLAKFYIAGFGSFAKKNGTLSIIRTISFSHVFFVSELGDGQESSHLR